MKKSENRKALPKFLLTLLIAGVIGGFIGALIGQLDRQIFMKASANAAYVFGYYIVPWLMIIDAIVILVFCLTLYKQAKALYDSWDQEDDEIINRAEAKINSILLCTQIGIILSVVFLACLYAYHFQLDRILTIVAEVFFFFILFETILFQQKAIDLSKIGASEKTVSVFDLNFQKKWLEESDEAEKTLIGKCAYKAYISTNFACVILLIASTLLCLLTSAGLLPTLFIAIIILVNMSTYALEGRKYNQTGRKLD